MNRLAYISVDVDSVASHLRGYGFQDVVDDGSAYRYAIPRLLKILGETGVTCTFFLIAEEAKQHPETVRSIIEAGHEVGCHSMTHRLPFRLDDPERRHCETAGAKELLETLTGGPVRGFRAPSWDATPELMESLIDAGFAYDASSYPSWVLLLLRWTVARRSAAGNREPAPGLQSIFGVATPHVLTLKNKAFAEFPISTTPFFRLPYYHTFRFLLPAPAFGLLRALALSRRSAVGYIFHAADFLGVETDKLDPRISRHPGMGMALGTKLELARRSIVELSSLRKVVSLGSLASELTSP